MSIVRMFDLPYNKIALPIRQVTSCPTMSLPTMPMPMLRGVFKKFTTRVALQQESLNVQASACHLNTIQGQFLHRFASDCRHSLKKTILENPPNLKFSTMFHL